MNNDSSNHQNMLKKKLDRANRDLSVLYEISNAMRTTLDLKHILYIILTGVTAHNGLGFNRAILFLVNHVDRCLEPQMAIGPESLEHAQKIWEYISDENQHLDDLIQEEKLDQNIEQKTLFQSVKQLKIPLSTTKDNLLITACIEGSPMHISQKQISNYDGRSLATSFPNK